MAWYMFFLTPAPRGGQRPPRGLCQEKTTHTIVWVDKTPFVMYITSMNKECRDCGTKVELEYEAPYQEYPGAHVWGGYWIGECGKCDRVMSVEDQNNDYNVQENTRGW